MLCTWNLAGTDFWPCWYPKSLAQILMKMGQDKGGRTQAPHGLWPKKCWPTQLMAMVADVEHPYKHGCHILQILAKLSLVASCFFHPLIFPTFAYQLPQAISSMPSLASLTLHFVHLPLEKHRDHRLLLGNFANTSWQLSRSQDWTTKHEISGLNLAMEAAFWWKPRVKMPV